VALSALMFVATAIGGTLLLGISVGDGEAWPAVRALLSGIAGLAFWRWVGLGAWQRSQPPGPDDPDPGARMGPWGVVGVVLTVLVLGGLGAGIVWAGVVDWRTSRAAEEVREDADLEARRNGLTVERVLDAEQDRQAWLFDQRGPDPYLDLLDVSGAEVVDTSVDPRGRAAILLRLPGSPPCVVVLVDRNDHVTSEVTSRCS
jgi:hypothetical protein